MNIEGKVVIVTGASSGIGLATAELFAQKGARVVLVARSKDKLKKIAKRLPHSFVVVTDMTEKKEIIAMVSQTYNHFGRVDILVNNAGQGYDAAVEEINTTVFKKLFELNLIGPLVAMQQVIPIMRQQKEGVIVNISSGTALMYLENMSAYSSLKRALVGLSLTAREELKKDGIMVSVVYPFITETDFEKNTIKHHTRQREMNNDDNFTLPKADSATYVAEKILEAIHSKKAEIYAHDWMNRQAK